MDDRLGRRQQRHYQPRQAAGWSATQVQPGQCRGHPDHLSVGRQPRRQGVPHPRPGHITARINGCAVNKSRLLKMRARAVVVCLRPRMVHKGRGCACQPCHISRAMAVLVSRATVCKAFGGQASYRVERWRSSSLIFSSHMSLMCSVLLV